ncbi:Hypothetical protein NocV09_01100160 [Nannochloropsis oceanica]
MGWRLKNTLWAAILGLSVLPNVESSSFVNSQATAFGYAAPPSSFYPPGSMEGYYPPSPSQGAPRRPLRRFPTFPDTPAGLAHDIAGNIAKMVDEDKVRQDLKKQAQEGIEAAASAAASSLLITAASRTPLPNFATGLTTSAPRLRVDLQLDDMSDFSEEWSLAVSHRYLRFYEKMLLTLRAQGYQRVVAVFGHREEASVVEKRLRQAGAFGQLKIEYLARRGDEVESGSRAGGAKEKRGVASPAFPLGGDGSRKRIDIGSNPDMVIFFNPQNVGGDLAELTEFQRLTAVATLRGAPVVLVNPALTAFSHLPQGMMDEDYVRPMILSDFKPCFQASAHKYKYNPFLSYSIVRRGGEEAEEGGGEGPWEVFAHDGRLPESGWAYLESRHEEPFRLEVESTFFDSCFYIQKAPGGGEGGEGGVPEEEEANSVSSTFDS